MTFTLEIPGNASPVGVPVDAGQTVFLLGANGTGKSALVQRFFASYTQSARRVSAHRQTWFVSGSPTISGQQRRDVSANAASHDAEARARWQETYANERPSIAVYDLVDAENRRARTIAAAVDSENTGLVQELRQSAAPIATINDLLRQANMPITISVRESDEIVATRKGSEPYSIAQLSDGERNALLLASNVLTSPPGTLLLIDEPERHLHRAIAAPLLRGLFGQRRDCAFVVSTHDITLAIDNPSSKVVLVRGCSFAGEQAVSWDVDVTSVDSIDESVRADILGARRTILFVEGDDTSLDKPLYAVLFPGASVVAKSSCRDVEHAVIGIKDSAPLHWLRPFGVIDNDSRGPTDVERLRAKGVHVLPVFSVESIYYDSGIQGRLAARHATVIGGIPEDRLADAKAAALRAIEATKKHLAHRVAEKVIREAYLKKIPNKESLVQGSPIVVNIDVAAAIRAEEATLAASLKAADLDALFRRYPVRESAALVETAKRLGFKDREMYEGAVRKMLTDDQQALAYARKLLGTLSSDIGV